MKRLVAISFLEIKSQKIVMTKFLIAVIIFVGAIALFNVGYDKAVKSSCIKLQAQAEENKNNPEYFITKINHDECKDAFGIIINAPIK